MKNRIIIAAIAALALLGVGVAPANAADPIYLPAPTQTELCADGGVYDDAHWNLPEVEDVFYGIYYYGTAYTSAPSWDEYGWEPGDQYLVIAGPDDWSSFNDHGITVEVEPSDYGIDSGGNVGWWFPGFDACSIQAAAKAPTWVNPAGPNNLTPVFTDTEAYTYSVTRYSTGKVKVVATANPGYVLVGTTQWQKLDSN